MVANLEYARNLQNSSLAFIHPENVGVYLGHAVYLSIKCLEGRHAQIYNKIRSAECYRQFNHPLGQFYWVKVYPDI